MHVVSRLQRERGDEMSPGKLELGKRHDDFQRRRRFRTSWVKKRELQPDSTGNRTRIMAIRFIPLFESRRDEKR